MILQTGMHVLIKNDTKNFLFDAGKIKMITEILPDFEKSRAFALDNDTGIWCIEDFDHCIEYPNLPME